MFGMRITAVFSTLSLTACAQLVLQQPTPRVGSTPEVLFQRVEAPVGGVIASKFDYSTIQAARTTSSAKLPGWLSPTIQVNTRLVMGSIGADTVWCPPTPLPPGGIVCLADADNDSKLEKFYAANGMGAMQASPMKIAPPLEISKFEAAGGEGFKYELLYQGISGNVIGLSYREYTENLIRPGFQQDLTYTLEPNGPTELVFRSIRLKVWSASNQAISYEVLAGF